MFRRRVQDSEADLKLILAQGQAILARLELIDNKIEKEKERKLSKEKESDGADERRT